MTDIPELHGQLKRLESTERNRREHERQYISSVVSPTTEAPDPSHFATDETAIPEITDSGMMAPETSDSEISSPPWEQWFRLSDSLSEIIRRYPQYVRSPLPFTVQYCTRMDYRKSLDRPICQLNRYVAAMDPVSPSDAPAPCTQKPVLAGGDQFPPGEEEDYASAWRIVEHQFHQDFSKDRSLKDLTEQMGRLIPELPRLREWVDCQTLIRQIHTEYPELEILYREILNGTLQSSQVENVFEPAFWQQWLETIYAQHTELRNFRVTDHENRIREFQRLDRDIIARSFQRIRQKLLNDPDRPSLDTPWVAPGSELGILKRELEKKRRRLSIRQLFQKIPGVLLRLKPCLMMSPLAVSTYLNSGDCVFDVVIFDEASQVCPWDAVGAIYRGRQLIVAGDQKQLPPSRYFEKQMDEFYDETEPDEEEAVSMDNFESILDMCCPLMNRFRLKWHYRSRREPLISFSNHHFYNDELVTFPGVSDDSRTDPAIRLRHVPDGVWHRRTNIPEAKETARLVLEHFRNHPEESLGVVTFSVDQQDAVEDAIEILREHHPELDQYFLETRESPFFVKNLETVQGDERDRMILCVGYARDPEGKLAMRFGPLNQAGGERRLNVAITRAKLGLTLVSSIKYSDISETKHPGPQLLRAYLEYAERGPDTLANPEPQLDPEPDSDSFFETEVETILRAEGLEVSRRIGCGGFRVDLALSDPEIPNQFILGIECDGMTCRNSVTARDRDRLRQEMLEGLGWTLCRVWSTDWWQNPENQLQRILEVCAQAKQRTLATECSTPMPRVRASTRTQEMALQEIPVIQKNSRQEVPRLCFHNIDDVPEKTIRSQALEIYRINGRIPREELLRQVRESLGFSRLGERIRRRLEKTIRDLEREELIITCSEESF
ncbi:MAG: DUF3320 domain-containing protein [Planctomycetia bacterium]|nr:DUF3320 domain-containing protein [Planctomycetia bacterium]